MKFIKAAVIATLAATSVPALAAVRTVTDRKSVV